MTLSKKKNKYSKNFENIAEIQHYLLRYSEYYNKMLKKSKILEKHKNYINIIDNIHVM